LTPVAVVAALCTFNPLRWTRVYNFNSSNSAPQAFIHMHIHMYRCTQLEGCWRWGSTSLVWQSLCLSRHILLAQIVSHKALSSEAQPSNALITPLPQTRNLNYSCSWAKIPFLYIVLWYSKVKTQ
jgi:hypothetical protein